MPKAGMNAAVVGSMLKKRAHDATVKPPSCENMYQINSKFVSYHRCHKAIPPFPSYRLKNFSAYTSSRSKCRPQNIHMGVSTVDVGLDISDGQSASGGTCCTRIDSEFGFEDVMPPQQQIPFPVVSEKRQLALVNTSTGVSYAIMYIGLVLVSLGVVVLFAGIQNGGRGLKGVILQVTGSFVLFFGIVCAIFPLLLNFCPSLDSFMTKGINGKGSESFGGGLSLVPLKEPSKETRTDDSVKIRLDGWNSDSFRPVDNSFHPGRRVKLYSVAETPGSLSKSSQLSYDGDPEDFDSGNSSLPGSNDALEQQQQNTDEIIINPNALMQYQN